MGRLPLLALVLLLLSGLGFAGHHAAYPLRVTVAISDLEREAGGLRVGDFSRSWPLKINQRALDRITVALPDGGELKRYDDRAAFVSEGAGAGFFVERPKIIFRLDGAAQWGPSDGLTVSLPTKLRDIAYQLPLGLAAFLFLAIWLGPGLRASIRPLRWRPLAVAGGALAVMLAGLLGLLAAKGAAVWLALTALVLGPLIAAAALLRAEAEATGRAPRTRESLIKLAVLSASALGCCVLFEAYLGWKAADPGQAVAVAEAGAGAPEQEWFELPEDVVRRAESRSGFLTLPSSWRRRMETVEGASLAFTWHDALHIRDKWGFRRLNGPFPAKDPAKLRIMVVGDSLTYGEGIEENWTYSRILERSLQKGHKAEVLNLGLSGYQSEEILGVLHRFLPELDPDLVVYAVCLNDFLPAEREDPAFSFPLPEAWRKYLLERTHLGRLFDHAYGNLLLTLELRPDFYDQILAGETAYQARFARDVSAMNRFVQEDEGLPPIIGIVFNQRPGGDPRAWDLVQIAENAMAAAGFDLISVLSWRERFKDRSFTVSRWESHPNELGHSAIAQHLSERLLRHSKLADYRVGAP